MLRILLLAGLTTTTVSAFMLGAVFGMTVAAERPPDAPQSSSGAAPPQSAGRATDAVEASGEASGPDAVMAEAAPAAPVFAGATQGGAAAGGAPALIPVDPAAAMPPDPGADPQLAALLASEPETYTLTAGTFTDPSAARRFADDLGAMAMPVQLVEHVDGQGSAWSEVTVGPFASSGGAATASQAIRRAFALTPVMRLSDVAP